MAKVKHLLSLYDVPKDWMLETIELAEKIKAKPKAYENALHRKTLLMIFEKASLRTRLSFETGMTQMGGHAIYYDVSTSPLGRKESIEDTAIVSGRYVDIIMARMLHFSDVKALADNAGVPVMDALSEMNHPCQILGDLLTIKEKKGKLEGLTLAYLGDCENNVTYSLMHGCLKNGMNVRLGSIEDKEFMPKEEVVKQAEEICKETGASFSIHHNALEAAKGADIVYTDSWMSYHIPKEQMEERKAKLMPMQVNDEVMKSANEGAIFMNCLPAIRGMEQTASVVDGPQSVVFDQAENRLHIQKAIMLKLLSEA